jgi:hypothetical protein
LFFCFVFHTGSNNNIEVLQISSPNACAGNYMGLQLGWHKHIPL